MNSKEFVKSETVKEWFTKYVDVQLEGRYNMVTERSKVANEIGISEDDVLWIQANYQFLNSIHPEIRKNAERKFMESIKSK